MAERVADVGSSPTGSIRSRGSQAVRGGGRTASVRGAMRTGAPRRVPPTREGETTRKVAMSGGPLGPQTVSCQQPHERGWSYEQVVTGLAPDPHNETTAKNGVSSDTRRAGLAVTTAMARHGPTVWNRLALRWRNRQTHSSQEGAGVRPRGGSSPPLSIVRPNMGRICFGKSSP